MNNYWWIFSIITAVFFILSGALIIGSYLSQKEKLKILRKSDKKYSDLFNNVSDIIYIHTLKGVITDINEPVSMLLGYSRDEILNKNISGFIENKFMTDFEKYLTDFERGINELSGKVLLFAKGGQKYLLLEYRSSVIYDDDGNKVAIRGIARDITEQNKVERSLAKSTWRAKKLLDESTLMRKNIDQISRELLRVHEEESRRISRELHDEVGQLLTSIKLNLKMLSVDHISDMMKYKKMVEDTKLLTDSVFTKIRSYLRELRPAALDSLGLIPAIRQLINQFSELTGIDASIIGDDKIDCLDTEQMNVLYRIVQESLTNIVKHAEAQSVTVMIEYHQNNVVLEVADDGKGFDTDKIKINQFERKNLGILGMQERVRLINGEFLLRSEIGEGTSIRVRIPVTIMKGEGK